jgi:hypothetical protein
VFAVRNAAALGTWTGGGSIKVRGTTRSGAADASWMAIATAERKADDVGCSIARESNRAAPSAAS